MDGETDIAVQDRFEVARETVADARARNVEGEVRRASVVVVRIREACDNAGRSAQPRRRRGSLLTLRIDDDVRSRVIKRPALLDLLRAESSARCAQRVSCREHDDVRLLCWLGVRDGRSARCCWDSDLGVQL